MKKLFALDAISISSYHLVNSNAGCIRSFLKGMLTVYDIALLAVLVISENIKNIIIYFK